MLNHFHKINFNTILLIVFITQLAWGNIKVPSEIVRIENTSETAQSTAQYALRVVFFHSPSCEDCHEVENALPEIINNWDGAIRLEMQNINDIEVFEKLLLYEEHYSAEVAAPPVIFVGEQYLTGAKNIIDKLDDIISCELEKNSVTFIPAKLSKQLPSRIMTRFQNLRIGAVALAGLLDGINPCAFTTIIFFLSMLAYLGKSKHQMVIVGLGFTIAVFATYLLLGFGLLGAIKTFSVSKGLSSGLVYAVAFLTFVLAGWSLFDFIRYTKTGSVKSITLGLPQQVKTKIHKIIRLGLTTRGLLLGSVSVGFLVALLESICTGQVYLPTIVFVLRAPGLRTAAVGYLLFYNLMFIIPLVVILIIAYFGVKSQRLGDFLRRHLAALKLTMALLFASLGSLLLTTI